MMRLFASGGTCFVLCNNRALLEYGIPLQQLQQQRWQQMQQERRLQGQQQQQKTGDQDDDGMPLQLLAIDRHDADPSSPLVLPAGAAAAAQKVGHPSVFEGGKWLMHEPCKC
jgi:hypothetical protein